MSEPMLRMLLNGLWETIVMTFVSGFFGFVIGLPAGVVLFLTRFTRAAYDRELRPRRSRQSLGASAPTFCPPNITRGEAWQMRREGCWLEFSL